MLVVRIMLLTSVLIFCAVHTCHADTIVSGAFPLEGFGADVRTFTYRGLEARRGDVTVNFDLTISGDFRFDNNLIPHEPDRSFLALNAEDSRIDTFLISSISDNDPMANYELSRFIGISLQDPNDDGNAVTGTYTSETLFSPSFTRQYFLPDNVGMFIGLDQSKTLALTVDSARVNSPEVQIVSIDLAFRSVAVPEPSTFAICGLVLIPALRRRRR